MASVLVVVGLAMVQTAQAATSDAAVIRIITSEGTLVVRVDDPDVCVRVEGSELVVTGAGLKELRLPTGDFATQDSDDGPPVGATIVTITRGDKEILNIRRGTALDEEAASASNSNPPQDATAAEALPATKRLFNPENGHDYQRIDVPMSWRVAKKVCEQLGGHLATATTGDENEFIYSQFGREHVCWLGATDEEDEGTWKWITGEPWDYENWHAGEPSNNNDGGVENYLKLGNTQPVVADGTSYFYRFGARWNDHVGSGEYHGASIAYPVCEWDEHDPQKAVEASPVIDEPSRLQGFQRATPDTQFAIGADHAAAAKARTSGYWPQWRGPNRDNMSADGGLLGEWPKEGPPLVWRVMGLGEGISPPSIADGRIFAISQHETTEYIRALDQRTGKHLWTALLGPAPLQSPYMRWLTQRPPTVDGDLLYAVSLSGELVCLRVHDGREVWRRSYVKDFAGKCGRFGYSDCPIVDGEKLICTPGGAEASIVALEKTTGQILWTRGVPKGGSAAYSNGVIAEIGGKRQFVTFLERASLVGLDVEDGAILWRADQATDGFTHSHTPIIRENHIVCINGFRSVFLKLLEVNSGDDVFSVKEVYSATPNLLSVYTDDSILVGDHLFETSRGVLSCFDWKSGRALWQKRVGREATATYAHGRLYLHHVDGTMKLVELTLEGPVVKSDFTLPGDQNAMGTTTPIVTGGCLYVRKDDQLFCYDVHKDAVQSAGRPAEFVQLDSVQSTAQRPQGAGDWPQWRGPKRDNVSQETGLLDQWPEGGPPLAWRVEGIGEGIASVSVAGGGVYTVGYVSDGEYAIALDEQTGEQRWRTRIGPMIGENPLMRWLSERSPTIDGERAYYFTANGELICLHTSDGRELWRKDYTQDFGGRSGVWGFCDYPLIDGEKLICTPGGPDATIVALDKATGDVIWKSAIPDAGPAAYAAMVLANAAGVRQCITFLESGLVSVSPKDGRLFWRYDKLANDQNSSTPIVLGDQIVGTGGRRNAGGLALLKIVRNDDALQAQEQYIQEVIFNQFNDSLVALDRHLYGVGGGLICVEQATGQIVWQAYQPPRPRRGIGVNVTALTAADGRLYLRQRGGWVRLVEATPTGHVERGSFAIPVERAIFGDTHPVIAGGRLYLRNDNTLRCYDVRDGDVERLRSEPQSIVLNAPRAQPEDEDAARSVRSVFVPTPQDVVEKMLELAKVKETDVVVDLGSGDGRIVITAAAKYRCRALGYEIDPELVELSRTKATKAQVDDLVRFENADIATVDVTDADVIAVYLVPRQLESLAPQLMKLKPGARIVSHQFEIPGIKADQTVEVVSATTGATHSIYFWTTPLSKSE